MSAQKLQNAINNSSFRDISEMVGIFGEFDEKSKRRSSIKIHVKGHFFNPTRIQINVFVIITT